MRRSAVALVLISLVTPAEAASDLAGLRWASDVRRVEELVAASLETGDVHEIERQLLIAHRLAGRVSQELPTNARFPCVSAASALANTAADLLGPMPAKALVNARADGRIYREQMAECERKLGAAGKSHLPF